MMSVRLQCGAGWQRLVLGMSSDSAWPCRTVYTAIEADDLAKYAERFNKDHPDIEIQWVRDSTGIITAKLLAEKDPQADMIWGLAATSLMLLKNEGMLEPYAPPGWTGSTRASSTAPIPRRGPAWTPGRR